MDDVLRALAEKYFADVNSPEWCLTPKHPDSVFLWRTAHEPRKVKSGGGTHWIKVFSAYQGDACLLYPFRTVNQPRGVVRYNFKPMEAHRAMCLHVNKLPPEGKNLALHRCGNGHLGCVTPKHLYWGDASDNAKDAWRHRRDGKPEVVPPPKRQRERPPRMHTA